jgi:acyl dehydratase
MSVLVHLDEKPPRSDATVAAVISPMTRHYRSVASGMWILSVCSGAALFAGDFYYVRDNFSTALRTGLYCAGFFALIAIPTTIFMIINVLDVRRLARRGTVFEGLTDAFNRTGIGISGRLVYLRVRFYAEGVERIGTFDVGGAAREVGVLPVSVLFEAANPSFAALILPNGAAIVGRVAIVDRF